MEPGQGGGGLALLGEVRAQLSSELVALNNKRQNLEAQLEAPIEAQQLDALEKELKEVDVKVEATQRMLGLVEATEQQLAGQGQGETTTEVRGG
jgi:predicted  nucleic acid-binding Zn-ribbon protein